MILTIDSSGNILGIGIQGINRPGNRIRSNVFGGVSGRLPDQPKITGRLLRCDSVSSF
jgi:hypothetical protein